MPELPEVEVVVRELRSKLSGEKIKSVDILWHRTFVAENGKYLPLDREIVSVGRHGKYIILNLDKGVLVVHLRMTGQIIIGKSIPEDKRHLRFCLGMYSGKQMLFFDSRKFGRVHYAHAPEIILNRVGIDALDPNLSKEAFLHMLKGRKSRIKSFLLDQRFVAGLGNIYIDESLFRAGIHPQTTIDRISGKKQIRLFEVIQDVLYAAIGHMGTTISDYKTTGGGFGTNQHYLYVYNKQDTPCAVCGTLIRKFRTSGRGTHYCPRCQPEKVNSG